MAFSNEFMRASWAPFLSSRNLAMASDNSFVSRDRSTSICWKDKKFLKVVISQSMPWFYRWLNDTSRNGQLSVNQCRESPKRQPLLKSSKRQLKHKMAEKYWLTLPFLIVSIEPSLDVLGWILYTCFKLLIVVVLSKKKTCFKSLYFF